MTKLKQYFHSIDVERKQLDLIRSMMNDGVLRKWLPEVQDRGGSNTK
jgi:hypothetical protein